MAYYSLDETGVYHVCKNCYVGNNKRENLRQGVPIGASLCNVCDDLANPNKGGTCEAGTPETQEQKKGGGENGARH